MNTTFRHLLNCSITQLAPLLRKHWPLLLGSSILLAFYWSVIFGDEALLYRDMVMVYLPIRETMARRLLSLEFPEWYNYSGLGSNYIGNIIVALLHPTMLFHLLLPGPLALSLSAVSAHFVAGLGMFFLLRRWDCDNTGSFIGAFAFAFSGTLVSMDGNLPYLLAGATIPWAVLAFWSLIQAISRLESISSKIPVTTTLSPKSLCGKNVRNSLKFKIKFFFIPLIATSFSMALLAYAGDIQALYLTSIFLFFIALTAAPKSHRILIFFFLGIAGIVAFLLASPQLLPAAFSLGARDNDAQAIENARLFALHPLRLTDFFSFGPPVLPDGKLPETLFFSQSLKTFWSIDIFLGASTLALASLAVAFSQKRRLQVLLLAGLGLFTLCLSLGTETNAPLYAVLQEYLPFWKSLRYPEKSLVFVAFAISALSGIGADILLKGKYSSEKQLSATASLKNSQLWKSYTCRVAFIAILGVLAFIAWSTPETQTLLLALSGVSPETLDELQQAATSAQFHIAIGIFLSLFCLLLAPMGQWTHTNIAPIILILSIIFPNITIHLSHSITMYRMNEKKLLLPPSELKTIYQKTQSNFVGTNRIYSDIEFETVVNLLVTHFCPGSQTSCIIEKSLFNRSEIVNLRHGTSSLFSIESLPGYTPLTDQGRQQKAANVLPDSVYWNGFSMAHAIAPNEQLTGVEDAFKAIYNPNAAPRIRLVQGLVAKTIDEAIALTKKAGFDPAKQVPVETLAPDFPASPIDENATIDVKLYAPEHIRVETHSATDATLFIADGFAPGWTASIDGHPVDIFPALVAGRAVPVPAGKHLVELTFRTPGLRLGFALAALGLFLCAMLFFIATDRVPNVISNKFQRIQLSTKKNER